MKDLIDVSNDLKKIINSNYSILNLDKSYVNDLIQARTIIKSIIKKYSDKFEQDDLLKCTIAIFNFLLNSDLEGDKMKTFNTPSNQTMGDLLHAHNTNMCDFIVYLNHKFNIIKNPLWDKSAREFFSDKEKVNNFFINAINHINNTHDINK